MLGAISTSLITVEEQATSRCALGLALRPMSYPPRTSGDPLR